MSSLDCSSRFVWKNDGLGIETMKDQKSRHAAAQCQLEPWMERISARQRQIRAAIGPLKLAALRTAAGVLSAPRLLHARVQNESSSVRYQRPWLPKWPMLRARPIHSVSDYDWVATLQQAASSIRDELEQVYGRFRIAAYNSATNPKPWKTYYFYLNGKAIAEHLTACPITASLLTEIPHNGLHVCFSAIEPGGGLNPHTGPTNASLTAHLGLKNCDSCFLRVADETIEYQVDQVTIFDDSFVHSVDHKGSRTRYTLMITFWHPDLNRLERAVLRSLSKSIKVG
jgi:ornithine lipid ester-linked acyl 2-hydroxylase